MRERLRAVIPPFPIRRAAPAAVPLFSFDPGWLFVVAGAALLSCLIIIPAQEDLRLAHDAKARALALESHRSNRLSNYAAYVDALGRRDDTLMKALAASQLNLAPADKAALVTSAEYITRSAGVFADLEPAFTPPIPSTPPDSLLYALSTRSTARMWVIVIGAVAILYGLLPTGESKPRRAEQAEPAQDESVATPAAAA
ncbi:MAG: hypothetical protein ACKVZJ_10940 [Phycisphaerales bacterium]